MRVDYAVDCGTPCDIERMDERTFALTPYTRRSGSTFYFMCVRVGGLAIGESGRLIFRWPKRWTEDDLPDGVEKDYASWATKNDPFVLALDQTLVRSDDGQNWTPLERVRIDPEQETAEVFLDGSDGDFLVSTVMPYRWGQYERLLDHVRSDDRVEVERFACSRAGVGMDAMTIPPEDGETDRTPTVYIQASQHATEFTGPIVVDHMIRWLLTDEGRRRTRGVTFQFVPLVDIDGTFYGETGRIGVPARPVGGRGRNPNRDWADPSWPEVAAVQRFLEARHHEGRRYVLGLDFHNGWAKLGNSGACYTIAAGKGAEDAYQARQREFADWMTARTDHVAPGSYWYHDTGGRNFATYFTTLTGGLAHTVEFSRHIWWNRDTEQYESARPEHPRRFAADAAEAMAEFFRAK